MFVVAWLFPHRPSGFVIEVCPDGQWTIAAQRSHHAQRVPGQTPRINEDQPYVAKVLTEEVVSELLQRLEALRIDWPEPQAILGGSTCGIEVEYAQLTVCITWNSVSEPKSAGSLHRWLCELGPDLPD